MPIYAYTGLTARGRTVTGVIDADSPKGARLSLRRTGIFPTAISEERATQTASPAGTRTGVAHPSTCYLDQSRTAAGRVSGHLDRADGARPTEAGAFACAPTSARRPLSGRRVAGSPAGVFLHLHQHGACRRGERHLGNSPGAVGRLQRGPSPLVAHGSIGVDLSPAHGAGGERHSGFSPRLRGAPSDPYFQRDRPEVTFSDTSADWTLVFSRGLLVDVADYRRCGDAWWRPTPAHLQGARVV